MMKPLELFEGDGLTQIARSRHLQRFDKNSHP